MDFKLVLSKLLTAFQEQEVRYALMGGDGGGGIENLNIDMGFVRIRRTEGGY